MAGDLAVLAATLFSFFIPGSWVISILMDPGSGIACSIWRPKIGHESELRNSSVFCIL
jgi:hypothetical protein